jgi:hypothetical protein
MNRGVVEKAVRESWLLTLVLGGALALAEGLLSHVLLAFREEIAGAWGQLQFVQGLIRALLGSELGDAIGPHAFQAIPWVHPVALALVFAHELTFCTRVPIGEIDRGTIDVLLGLPVTRWQVYLGETAVFLVAGAAILGAGAAGNVIGALSAGADPLPAGGVAAIVANGYCLYLAVGGSVYLFASICDRRGRAVGWGLAVVLASFLLSFLAQFWEPARSIAFLGLLDYYRPVAVVQSGGWPLGDMAVLALAGGALWTLGGVVFSRRDICTV